MSETVAYLAGLMDGEGSFSIQIQKPHGRPNPRLTMTLKYGAAVLQELVEEFGGKVYFAKDGMARWSLGGRDAVLSASKDLLPYLRIKRGAAERFIEALEGCPQHRWTPSDIERIGLLAAGINVW